MSFRIFTFFLPELWNKTKIKICKKKPENTLHNNFIEMQRIHVKSNYVEITFMVIRRTIIENLTYVVKKVCKNKKNTKIQICSFSVYKNILHAPHAASQNNIFQITTMLILLDKKKFQLNFPLCDSLSAIRLPLMMKRTKACSVRRSHTSLDSPSDLGTSTLLPVSWRHSKTTHILIGFLHCLAVTIQPDLWDRSSTQKV